MEMELELERERIVLIDKSNASANEKFMLKPRIVATINVRSDRSQACPEGNYLLSGASSI